jgi:serine/threonine protein kinase
MHTPLALLRFVAKALLNAAGGGVAGEFAVEVLPELAQDVWGWWCREPGAGRFHDDIESLAQAPRAEVTAAVTAIVAEVAADQPDAVRQSLVTYLLQVPASIQQTLRRPSNPAGTTVPATFALKGPDDLLRLLPARLPRFRPGDRPLPGIDWELVELLGVGGFGEVWKAANPHLASAPPAALKFCLDPAAARLLRHEAAVLDRVLRQGRRPGIVPLIHTYLSAASPCLEYEYVAGGDLAGWLCDAPAAASARTGLVTRLMHALARIVASAHELEPPIVHRDLKPANILVQLAADSRLQLWITDFGIGGIAAGQAIAATRGGTTRGQFLTTALRGAHTPLYASPQQLRGAPPDPRDDVHALGVIWYQLLTGDLTAGAPTGLEWPDELRRQGLSDAQVRLLASCLEPRPERRPASAVVLADRLAGWTTGTPPAGPNPSGPPDRSEWWRQ